MGNSTPLISGLTCFLVMEFTGEGSGLTVAKIFATMELMVTTRLIVFFLGISMGFYFELIIIFDRFCTIYNIEDKRMIEIDPKTKEPIKKTYSQPAKHEDVVN